MNEAKVIINLMDEMHKNNLENQKKFWESWAEFNLELQKLITEKLGK
jgi:hypothetical protein